MPPGPIVVGLPAGGPAVPSSPPVKGCYKPVQSNEQNRSLHTRNVNGLKSLATSPFRDSTGNAFELKENPKIPEALQAGFPNVVDVAQHPVVTLSWRRGLSGDNKSNDR
ncbi:hypothetical protein E2562_010630 [Oryza meyeriana var. granulata]|uniref:Uncharacterized protein n=1 Tax=Oryza meyeriana var. granulata TaxID=110450 RepID=A0A6G1EVT0_9ORYZ|nr:hypothetical protein E2562_010630 [Oryza meyeriana var. granulata]